MSNPEKIILLCLPNDAYLKTLQKALEHRFSNRKPGLIYC